MRRAIYVINFVAVIATVFAWPIEPMYGAVSEFFLGCLQMVCLLIYLAQWRSLSVRTKKHLRQYLFLLAGYGAIVGVGALIYNIGGEAMLPETISAWFVFGAAVMLAFYFTYVCYLAHLDKKELFTEDDLDVLDSGFVDGKL